MSRFKGSFIVKLNVSASIKKETKIKLPLLVIKSGIFPDARHYAKNITAVNLLCCTSLWNKRWQNSFEKCAGISE